MNGCVIEKIDGSMTPRFFREMGQLHVGLIHSGILESLGARFVGILYQELLNGAHVLMYAAFQERQLIGFLTGTPNLQLSVRSISARGFARLIATASLSLLKPKLVKKMLQSLSYFRRHPQNSSADAAAPDGTSATRAELLSIAVSHEAQGRGIGKLLLAAFEGDLHALGFSGRYFVTTNSEEKGSNAFYRAAGFQLIGQKPHHDLVLNVYARTLAGSPPTPATTSIPS